MSIRLKARAVGVAANLWGATASPQTVGDLLTAGTAALLRIARNGHRRRRAEHGLSSLSDAALKDIGIRRPDIRSIADALLAGGTAQRRRAY